MPADVTRSEVVHGIVTYVRANPLACDTCHGIVHWWLGLDGCLDEVQAALDWLVAAGALERLPAADGRIRYRRADDARGSDAALALLLAMHAPGR